MPALNVSDLLYDTLDAEFHLPIYRQGSMSEDEDYPESFFTFWNNSTEDDSFYDGEELRTNWSFDLNFYSSDPSIVFSTLIAAKTALKKVGFIPDGNGYDAPSDEETHTGRGMELLYIDTNGGIRNG